MAEWNHILKRKDYSPEKPAELVVNLMPVLKKKNAKRILDLGCGAGRHVIYLTERRFEVHGVDLSEVGIKITKERIKKRKLEAGLIKADMKSIPYIDSCFGAVICINTIYHQRKMEIQKTISEIYRVLRDNGLFLANFHSKKSSRYGKGIKVEEDTFMDEIGPERGILHHFVDEKELRRLLKDFRKIDLKTGEEKVNNYLRSRIIVTAEK